MGQKVNPHGLRVGVIKDWDTKWYADKKNFALYLKEDYEIRKYIKTTYFQSAISSIKIDRIVNKVTITIYTGKPGNLIGVKGSGIDAIKKGIAKICKGKAIFVNVSEIKKVDADAQLMAESVADQLEKRASFRRCMKQAISKAMKVGAKGVKIMLSGRLDGAEIARSEQYHEGSIPLQTIRADIDYGFSEAHTTFGIIGVKVWVYRGEVIGKAKKSTEGGEA